MVPASVIKFVWWIYCKTSGNEIVRAYAKMDFFWDSEFDEPSKRKHSVTESEQLILNQTEVALEITKKLFCDDENKNKNIVFSPLSMHIILSMITAGTASETRENYVKFLKSKSIEEVNSLADIIYPIIFADGSHKGGPLLYKANGVWIDQSLSFKPSFRDLVDRVYMAELKEVDFKNNPEKVRKEVNLWGEKQSKGLIKNVLPPNSVNSNTKLILANALYFKGIWDKKFKPVFDTSNRFYSNTGPVEVPFMTNDGKQYINKFKDFKVLKLLYKQGKDDKRQYSMCIFLPNEKDGLPSIIDQICSDSEFIESHIPMRKVETGRFLIPKFKISFEFEALELLKSLGFSGMDLTEMADAYLEVTGIYHKSAIEVNERGTEAVAVTAAVVFTMLWAEADRPPVDFVADHPFVYLIREEVTKSVLFIGQVLNPASEN